MAIQSMIIKDGAGNTKSLTVESSSYGFIPFHQITSSVTSPVYVVDAPVTTVAQSAVTTYNYGTSASGTFAIASNSTTRKGLTVFNPGPSNLFLALSTAGGTTNGFTLASTASAPTLYSFIIYPSGTYTADSTTAGVYHGGYFISGSTSVGVFISSIS
jgi:hypothetical protein